MLRPSTILALAPLLVLLLASSCASGDKTPHDAPPQGIAGAWVLEELPGSPLLDLAAGEATPSLSIDSDGALSGFAGVNRFTGRFDAAALAEGRLSAGPLASTRMAGPPAAAAVEDAFLAALTGADGYRCDGATLVLTEDGRAVARLGRSR